MEVVANIAINDFHCKLSGGFIRDWIVLGECSQGAYGPYTGNLSDWVDEKDSHDLEKFSMKEGVLPKDLDFELPNSEYFDPLRFISVLTKVDIKVDFFQL